MSPSGRRLAGVSTRRDTGELNSFFIGGGGGGPGEGGRLLFLSGMESSNVLLRRHHRHLWFPLTRLFLLLSRALLDSPETQAHLESRVLL